MKKVKDGLNLQLAASQSGVDQLNKEFYGRFNYPWPPMTFQAYTDPSFWPCFLNQDIGHWRDCRVPDNPKIWVGGCGTNQSVITALKFPQAHVLGTDISLPSLETSEDSALQLGVENLELEEKSLNNAAYEEEFDFVICTGVIHHNAEPVVPLKRLAAALKPGGVMELMVYNFYHMLLQGAFQTAIRGLCGDGASMSMEDELKTTRELIRSFPERNLMADFLTQFANAYESDLADNLLQPVMHSYTIETFVEMLDEAGLEMLMPCVNQFDRTDNRLSWNLSFGDSDLQRRYESMDDQKRWQLSNLLMFERSPMLWFYVQRKDSPFPRKSEQQVCREFLETRFEKKTTPVRLFSRNEQGDYAEQSQGQVFPGALSSHDHLAKLVYNQVAPTKTMSEIFAELSVEPTFQNINRVRVNLTTSTFPYLAAVK